MAYKQNAGIIDISAAAGTFPITLSIATTVYKIDPKTTTLQAGDITISASGSVTKDMAVSFIYPGGLNQPSVSIGVYNFSLLGVALKPSQVLNAFSAYCYYNGTSWEVYLNQSGTVSKYIDGSQIMTATIPLNALVNFSRGGIIAANSTSVASVLNIGSPNTVLQSGGLDLKYDFLSNANIAAGAAIALSKLAVLTASKPLMSDSSGVIQAVSQIPAANGGTGIDSSGATGFPKVNSGAWSVGAIADSKIKRVSFEASGQGPYTIYWPFPCIVVQVRGTVVNTIAGTDNGSILFQDNAGSNFVGGGFTSGAIAVTAGGSVGDEFGSTVTANNIFSTGQTIQISTSKTTPGGQCDIELIYTRTT